jgi:UDP-N-acetyl-D-galactosamine dehydrogenase
VGLGYVGLTLAVHLDDAGYDAVGYDVDREKVDALDRGTDPVGEFGDRRIADSALSFTDDAAAIGQAEYVHVSLPTPVDESGTPDLSGLEAACEIIGRQLADDAVVVFESTLYPGATRDVLEPALERGAREQGGATFGVAYSPERIVPGGTQEFSEVTKIVGAADDDVRTALETLYDDLLDADVHVAEDVETAEAAKCLENIQRDVNIGLVNEFAMGCRQLDVDLDPRRVIEAAGTKWNFEEYWPGIVGGHCIPVDPHYLRHKFEQCGFDPQLLRTARETNQEIVSYVASMTINELCRANATAQPVGGPTDAGDKIRTEGSLPEYAAGSRVMLLGFTYKPNVSDVRNSGVEELAAEFGEFDLEVCGYDPYHDAESAPESYEFEVLSELDFDGVDATVLLTSHDELADLDAARLTEEMNENPVLVDVDDMFDPEAAAEHGLAYEGL